MKNYLLLFTVFTGIFPFTSDTIQVRDIINEVMFNHPVVPSVELYNRSSYRIDCSD